MTIKDSYTSADVFPTKILHNKILRDDKIIPLHIQVIPTNDCNLSCNFCSCSDRDKEKKLSLEQILKLIDDARDLGTKAMTITGGGEPLIYPHINTTIDYAGKNNIEVGLVTNGILLNKLMYHDNLTWCRISVSDDRSPTYTGIKNALKVNPDTDWAFSYVVTNNPNWKNMRKVIEFGNKYNFSHIRLVSDLLDLENVPDAVEVKIHTHHSDIKGNVIYQGRKEPDAGTKDCYISLLKPVISPEGIFPCCGTQYAIAGERKDMVNKMKMGEVKDFKSIIEKQRNFDGSNCDTCYYGQYNDALNKMQSKPEHRRFV